MADTNENTIQVYCALYEKLNETYRKRAAVVETSV
jgi:hypothetical protein